MSSVVWLAASRPRFLEDVDFNVCFLGLLLRRCMRAMTLLGDGDGNHRMNTYSTTRTHRWLGLVNPPSTTSHGSILSVYSTLHLASYTCTRTRTAYTPCNDDVTLTLTLTLTSLPVPNLTYNARRSNQCSVHAVLFSCSWIRNEPCSLWTLWSPDRDIVFTMFLIIINLRDSGSKLWRRWNRIGRIPGTRRANNSVNNC